MFEHSTTSNSLVQVEDYERKCNRKIIGCHIFNNMLENCWNIKPCAKTYNK